MADTIIPTNTKYIRRVLEAKDPDALKLIEPYLAKIDSRAGRVTPPVVVKPPETHPSPPIPELKPEEATNRLSGWAVEVLKAHGFDPTHAVNLNSLKAVLTPDEFRAVCASGMYGNPGGPWEGVADWSVFTGVYGVEDESNGSLWHYHVWKQGHEIDAKDGDALFDQTMWAIEHGIIE